MNRPVPSLGPAALGFAAFGFAALGTLSACSVEAPKDDDSGGFSADGSADGAGEGAGDGGGGAPGSLSGEFDYIIDFDGEGRCAVNATVLGEQVELSCPECDFTLERSYAVAFTVGASVVEGACADSEYSGMVEAFDGETLGYLAGYWGFGTAGGGDVLVLAYNYGYGDQLYTNVTLPDGQWDRATGAFQFSYTSELYGDDGYYGGPDTGVAPPPPAGPTGELRAQGSAR